MAASFSLPLGPHNLQAFSTTSLVILPPNTKLSLFAPTRFFLSIPIRPSPPSSSLALPPCCSFQEAIDLPPNSKQEALLQARSSLSTFLDKALFSSGPSTLKQRRQHRQLRLRVEIPLLDYSTSSRASLLLDLLTGFAVGRRGNPVSFAVFCDSALVDGLSAAQRSGKDSEFKCHNLASTPALTEDTQAVILVASSISDVSHIEDITKMASPRPVVLLNPAWSEEEETESPKAQFLQSFEVVYSYIPLAIQGLFSKTEGAVLKHVRSGAPAGRPWLIFVKEGDAMKCVSSLMKRPNAAELETALYNAVAANSPVTKSISFLRGLVGGR